MHIEQTLVLLKPDTIERGLIGRIISRFEDRGLRVAGLKLLIATPELARAHYGDFVERYTPKLGKEKSESIIKEMTGFLTSGPIIAMAIEGVEAVKVVRKIVGATYPDEAPAGTIRGDFAHVSQAYANNIGITVKNLVHASGSLEEAKVELGNWFKPEEIWDYKTVHHKHTIV
ncbi:MAG: nucleoside-diphosphate kinase [Candidatus Berkelbacteria bacterium]|nr:MAG: nucleoside-diphosphate kinase [Candidatus Berkelbacteria bacterium]QQG51621.1 MAG: nucleoside-diphosphate kinase [Candidatus Berkelbacteria bacterium]